jgi:HPt (histidine-containing phosphotransfer) domain-containing protein
VELIELFLQEAPTQLQALERAVKENDYTSLSRIISAATSLKGSAGNLGARNLAALCDEIEQTAKNWSLAEVLPLVDRARQELGRVRVALEQIKQG